MSESKPEDSSKALAWMFGVLGFLLGAALVAYKAFDLFLYARNRGDSPDPNQFTLYGSLGALLFAALCGWAGSKFGRAIGKVEAKKRAESLDDAQRVKCPSCAELIRPEAKVCPFCRNPTGLEAAK